MKNVSVIREYIKESISENILGDDVELSYADHLEKLKLTHASVIENILRQNIYSDNRYGGTSIYEYFNRNNRNSSRPDFEREELLDELMQEGGAAIDDIFHNLPTVPYAEDGINEHIRDIIADNVYDGLLKDLISLMRKRHRVYENRIFGFIRKTANNIANEWALVYLKKKKLETDYIDAEDPGKQIIDNLNLESHNEQVQTLIDLFVNQYYENVTSDPQTALQDLKDGLSDFIDIE